MSTTSSTGHTFPPFTPHVPTPSVRPASRRRQPAPAWLAPVLVGAVVLAVALATMSPWPVGVYYDDAIYLILGKALASGEGYRYLNLPGHPAATHYPPGYPALLALLWRIAPAFPENVAVFKLANAVLLAVAAGGLFAFARRQLELPIGIATVSVLLGCLMIPVVAVAGVLFSEPMFLAMLAFALPVCERALNSGRRRDTIVAALLAAALTLVRTLGLPLVVALVAGLLIRRRRRDAAIAATVSLVLLLPWQLWTAAHAHDLPLVISGHYGSYIGTVVAAVRAKGLGYLARVTIFNVADLARPIGAVFAPGGGRAAHTLAVLSAAIVFGVGAFGLMRRAPVTALFLLGYSAIVLAWPYALDRFLWGVWPVLLPTFGLGADVALRGLTEHRTARAPLAAYGAVGAAVLMLTLGLVRYNARGYHEQWWDAAQRAEARRLIPLVEWVERNTRPIDVIASDGDPLVHLYTGRYVVPTTRWAAEVYPGVLDSASRVADLRAVLAAYPVRYLLLSSSKSPSAPATAELRAGPHPQLESLTVLPGGGAAFTTATRRARE